MLNAIFSWEVLKCGGNGEMIYAGKLIVSVPQLPVRKNREGQSIIVVITAVKQMPISTRTGV